MMVWLYWATALTLTTVFSAYIVRRRGEEGYATLTAMYTIYLAASQILATRFVKLDLGFMTIYAPAAVFIYPFVAQAIDMINEVYGYQRARTAILTAFITQILLALFIMLVGSLPSAPFFAYEEAWRALFMTSIRVTAASWIAFLICSNLDALVFDRLKKMFLARERSFIHDQAVNPYIWARSTLSDLANLTLDSVLFVVLAFYGIAPVKPLILGQIVTKNLIGFIDNPWFVLYKRLISRDKFQLATLNRIS